ncbi:MAG: N-6 DNA methylase, partial [Clostridia bacterium]
MLNKVKNLGQIYTPTHIVNDMLDIIDYQGKKILQKHIIVNSCGDGAFLEIIIDRYIKAYKEKHNSLIGIEKELEIYIHGIEIDKGEYLKCINNLSQQVFLRGLSNIKWNIINDDTLENHLFDGKMDYVVGNPPYIRIHNLNENFHKIRNYDFCKSGMSDMFIVFYEIGFGMLSKNGKLCYI